MPGLKNIIKYRCMPVLVVLMVCAMGCRAQTQEEEGTTLSIADALPTTYTTPTPTLTPTETFTPSPTITTSPTSTPSKTPIPSPTDTPPPSNTPTATIPPICPGAQPGKLQIDDQAQVNFYQVSARSAPSFSSRKEHVLAAGQVVEIIGGPACADNAVWWMIFFAGRISSGKYLEYEAWMPEADEGTYYLVKVP